jgi:hypothetical protein
MVVLYIVGGIGIGLFFMLRARYVLWRQAAIWGAVVGGLQALAMLNAWPLMWMSYDTAVSRSTFILGQIGAVLATLFGFSAFMALSFMAAETLTRRAFGHHPQFWRVWTRQSGSSTTILGQTVAGYLLVALFFAYDVALYAFATRVFGWWTPSEALFHPDVLATYLPWLSAIANSLQAGFWEECLFRAVPIAGAALIGDRFGKRTLFVVVAFVVQSIIFGAGHAPYPTQPSYARPVELILPSIGFGLLYLCFGLLPGIVLHFAFDVVWFALPIFLADAPGIWFQRFMVIAMTFVPLLIVLWRRWQVGMWTSLPDSERNAAWTPPTAPEPTETVAAIAHAGIAPIARRAWLALGAAGLVVCVWSAIAREPVEMFSVSRTRAIESARSALAARGVALGPEWRALPLPENGLSGRYEFVATTAGEARRRELLGRYLAEPRWNVRFATFEGDVAERAEEWRVFVTKTGTVLRVEHTLPEARAGASLDEAVARSRAVAALVREYSLDVTAGQAREISAHPSKRAARTDWTFTFADLSVPPLPQGELRVEVLLAGDEVAHVRRFVFVPEEWERSQRAGDTRNIIVSIIAGVVFGGLLVAAAVGGIVSWSRRRFAPRLFFAVAALMLSVTIAVSANAWPSTEAVMQTQIPLPIQLLGVIGVGVVGLIVTAALAGLAIGAQSPRLAEFGALPEREAVTIGVAVGAAGAALSALAMAIRTPDWAEAAELTRLGAFVPFLGVAIEPIAGLLTRIAIILSLLVNIHHSTGGWRNHRIVAAIVLALVGFLAAGAPVGSDLTSWFVGGVLLAAGLVVVYTTALRADLTMVPIVLATMLAIRTLMQGSTRPFPAALPGAIVAAVLTAAVGWWLFRALRKGRRPQIAPID